MRVVVALGGNALTRAGQAGTLTTGWAGNCAQVTVNSSKNWISGLYGSAM